MISIENCGLKFIVKILENGVPYIAYFGKEQNVNVPCLSENTHASLLEMRLLGCDINEHHGSRHTGTYPGAILKYSNHRITENDFGKLLEIDVNSDGIVATVSYQFYKDASAVRSWVVVTNNKDEYVALDYITSFCLYNLTALWQSDWEENAFYHVPYNTWHGEMQWKSASAFDWGLVRLQTSSLRRLCFSQTGSWSSGEYLPMGVLENKQEGTSIFWQIEHNGPWYWESSDVKEQGLYLQLTGPNGDSHHFKKVLKKGESFETVTVTVGVAENGFCGAMRELTKCRRAIYRDCDDVRNLPIIFNDYMNCLMGDPSEERCLPLIDAAAEIGCEYYVMDAGWFSNLEGGDDSWWSSLGEFNESKKRFPNGLKYVMDYARSKGMIPGLWIEVEDIGAECPLADKLPDDWFFMRDGKRVMEHGRYQFDYRNQEVFKYFLNKVNKIIDDYNLGYLKIDYNINIGHGSDFNSDDLGDALLEHNRAYLHWIDTLISQHKDLVIENCASGGMRMDYAMLSRLSIQSTSDQTDWRLYSAISSMASTACTPEQSAVWSYPALKDDEEVVVYNMVNAILGRVHQSGFLNKLPEKSFKLVKEGLDCYKNIRSHIRKALPFWPLGIINIRSPYISYGLEDGNTLLIAVWRANGEESKILISIPQIKGKNISISCIYPKEKLVSVSANIDEGIVRVELENKYSARLFKITIL